MSRYTIFIALFGGLLFFLSTLRIDIFTWKDSNDLERVVITTRSEETRTDYPAYPEELKSDERLTHQEGIGGLGKYGFQKIKSCFPPKEEGEGEGGSGVSGSSHVSIPHRPHSVSKPPKDGSGEDPGLEAPSVQVTDTVENALPKQDSDLSLMREDYQSAPNVRKIKRYFEAQDELIMGSFSMEPMRPEYLAGNTVLFEEVLGLLAQFDLLAVQGFYAENTQFLQKIVYELNLRTGRKYDFVALFPEFKKKMNTEFPTLFFLFDTNVLEVMPDTAQFAGYPNKPFLCPPLTARFQAKKTSSATAFSFIAANVQLYPGYEQQDLQHFPSMIDLLKKSVSKSEFDHEDDVIIFGNFGIEPQTAVVGDMVFNKTVSWANTTVGTKTFGSFKYISENILFQERPLQEFTSQAGVWDLRQQFSGIDYNPFDDHPVWAIFSIYEGGKTQN
ncbi:MAG: hypothetical protein IJD43_02550 [Thermoguttaceae bacterium]|nr:hypothetical protein [Thermoguttaceae bacterium]